MNEVHASLTESVTELEGANEAWAKWHEEQRLAHWQAKWASESLIDITPGREEHNVPPEEVAPVHASAPGAAQQPWMQSQRLTEPMLDKCSYRSDGEGTASDAGSESASAEAKSVTSFALNWLIQNGYETLCRHEQAILGISSSRTLWKRAVSDILRWRHGQQGSLQTLIGCEQGIARHVRVSDRASEFCQLPPGTQNVLAQAVVIGHIDDLSKKMSVNDICALAIKTRYYEGLGGSFPALEQKVKLALQSTRLSFKEICSDSGVLDFSTSGCFIYANPVWSPGAVEQVLEALNSAGSVDFMVIASGNTWRWVSTWGYREELVLARVPANLPQPIRSVFAGFGKSCNIWVK